MPLASALVRLLPSALLARLAAAAHDTKASRTGPLIAYESLGGPVWSPRDYAAFAREGFMQNAIVYRCVRMICEAGASIPLCLYQGPHEIEDHPLLALIKSPSPHQTGVDFLESFLGYLLVAGNSYVEAVALNGELRELYSLRPDRITILPGQSGWPDGYTYTAAGGAVTFSGDVLPGIRPILHMRLFHPVDDHYGMSPIEAAAVAIDIHNQASKWNKALLDNAARPSGALVYAAREGRLSPEQFERLKNELQDGFAGAKNAGRPLLLEGGLDWKPLSMSPKDMDFIEAKHAAAREIALALGVPPMLLGIPGDNTFSNYQEANRVFWRNTVVPLMTRACAALSDWLGDAYSGGPVTLSPDLDGIEALSPERDALWARLEKTTFLTDDEKRAAIGYSPKGSPAEPPEPGGKFSPGQPRVPSGSPGGGRWAGPNDSGTPAQGGGGDGTTPFDSAADPSSIGTGDGSTPGDGGLPSDGTADNPVIIPVADTGLPSPYSPDKPGWHSYKAGPNTVCSAELACTEADMKEYLSRFSFPGQDPNVPVKNNDKSLVIDPTTGISAGHIRTSVSTDGLTITNTTLPDHIFYDGQVVRQAVQGKDGSWFMVTTGRGNNVTTGMATINQWFGPGIFTAEDKAMRQYIEKQRRGN